MGAWKQFLASDIIVNPFEVNKGFSFPYSDWTNSDVQLDIFLGTYNPGTFYPAVATTTGLNSTQYQTLVYESIKELYYFNFTTSSYGDSVITASLLPGSDPSGDVFRGPTNPTGRFDNYLQSTLTPVRNFPTESGEQVVAISIPNFLFGDYIQPNSFVFEYSSSLTIIDDGEGNLNSSASFSWDTGELEYFYYSESLDWVSYNDPQDMKWSSPSNLPTGYTFISASWQGNAGRTPFIDANTTDPVQEIDNQGITYDESTGTMQSDSSVWAFQDTTGDTGPALFTWMSSSALIKSVSAGENVGNIIYPHGMAVLTNQNLPLSDISINTDVTCSFSSSYTIYETQYKATINENEFNFSNNPSLISGSTDGTMYSFVTSSYFSPYVTTVGLYNEAQELLAVGKLSQPLPTSPTTDTTIVINLDR